MVALAFLTIIEIADERRALSIGTTCRPGNYR